MFRMFREITKVWKSIVIWYKRRPVSHLQTQPNRWVFFWNAGCQLRLSNIRGPWRFSTRDGPTEARWSRVFWFCMFDKIKFYRASIFFQSQKSTKTTKTEMEFGAHTVDASAKLPPPNRKLPSSIWKLRKSRLRTQSLTLKHRSLGWLNYLERRRPRTLSSFFSVCCLRGFLFKEFF